MLRQILIVLLLISTCYSQPYTVIENKNFGLPGEPEFLVEDNGTLTTPINRNNPKLIETLNLPGRGYTYQYVFIPEDYHTENAVWNYLLLQKQIDNINKRLLTATGITRDNLLQTKMYLQSILSMVQAEISHYPKISK